MKYEERHRELRTALLPSSDPRPLLERQLAVWTFDERTAPLVDEVVADYREYGGHKPDCASTASALEMVHGFVPGPCDCGWPEAQARLAKLDEEASRG